MNPCSVKTIWAVPGVTTALSLAITQAWAQSPLQAPLPPPAASSATAAAPSSNAQVLQSWQAQTGQTASVNEEGGVEFHGELAVDVYNNHKSAPSGNPVLSPLPQGTFGRITFQGDVRTTTAEGDVTYLQGVVNSGSDRSLMPRYNTQIGSLQGGRAGPGYQLAVGDVVAGLSSLGSNLGLRGLLGQRQAERVTFIGFAGTVAESWEALLNAPTLEGLAPRTRYLRDVFGGKAELKYDEQLASFVTLQSWRDRTGSAALPPGTPAASGTSASIGGKYMSEQAQVSAEIARSAQTDMTQAAAGLANQDRGGSGNAFIVDATYRWNAVGLRAGYHDLSTGYASLALSAAPGVREAYVGGDWNATPQLTLGSDLRHALTRVAGTVFALASQSLLDSWTNRVSYNVAALPGLVLSVSDTRNKGKDALGNPNINTQTQYNVGYASGSWSTQLGAGSGRSRSPVNPLADSNTLQWQASLARSFSDLSSLEVAPSWTASAQLFASGQTQSLINAGTQVRTVAVGLNTGLQSQRYGNFNGALQRQQSTQPVAGQPTLVTTSLILDWSRALTPQWKIKTYARLNYRNYGSFALQVDERVVGLQGVYQW